MAVYSAVPPPPESPPLAGTSQAAPLPLLSHHDLTASGTIDIEAWTISALESLSVSSIARGTGTPLSIPLDEAAGSNEGTAVPPHQRQHAPRVTISVGHAAAISAITPPQRPPSRRDSMRRRDALLKGKEGSRQRRRWDMARLTDVPNVQPPLPSDWEPRPTYPVHHIPYHVAQFWDKGLRQQVEEKKAAFRRKNRVANAGAGKVPRDLRETVKRIPGVKGWVRELEEPVRQFLIDRGMAQEQAKGNESLSSEEDDEVVFAGRNGPTGNGGKQNGWKKARREVREKAVDSGIVFDSSEDDGRDAFKRWLTHSISDYYGLDSRSVTMGKPARRCVYVGIRDVRPTEGHRLLSELPRPLWDLF